MMGVVAILMIVLPENSLPDQSDIFWILFVMIAILCSTAENIILAARSAVALGPVRLSLGMNTAAVLITGPIVYWSNSFVWPSLEMSEVDIALVGLGLGSVIAYTMFIHAVSRYGPVFASQTGYIVTLAGVFWGLAIFDEVHTLWVWGALVTMIIGLVLVKPRKIDQ
ncbi:MAG: hypothetical protein V6Z81_06080 [Parvularculales bacterium]